MPRGLRTTRQTHQHRCQTEPQEEEETEDSFRNMEREDDVSAGKTGGGMQGQG
jgi:hypothetical protein